MWGYYSVILSTPVGIIKSLLYQELRVAHKLLTVLSFKFPSLVTVTAVGKSKSTVQVAGAVVQVLVVC